MMADRCHKCGGMVGRRVLVELEGKVCEDYCFICGEAETIWVSLRLGTPAVMTGELGEHHPRLPVGPR